MLVGCFKAIPVPLILKIVAEVDRLFGPRNESFPTDSAGQQSRMIGAALHELVAELASQEHQLLTKEMRAVHHRTSVAADLTGGEFFFLYYQAECSCGFRGHWSRSKKAAYKEANEHMSTADRLL